MDFFDRKLVGPRKEPKSISNPEIHEILTNPSDQAQMISERELIDCVKKTRVSFQTNLFTKDKSTILFSENLSSFQKYWVKIFPNVINPHIATDQFKIIAITDKKSELDEKQKKISLVLPSEPFKAVWKKFISLNKTRIFNRITCIAYSKSLLHFIPSESDYEILMDWGSNIKYSLTTIEGAKNAKKENITDNPLINLWGKSFLPISSQLITKSSQNMQIFIKMKSSKALIQKLKKMKKYVQMDFSGERIDNILQLMEDYFKTLKNKPFFDQQSSKKSFFPPNFTLTFFSDFLSFEPKPTQNESQIGSWRLFLGRLTAKY